MTTISQLQTETPGGISADKTPSVCRTHDNDGATLPRHARLPINRCNLPAVILGSLTFQRHPTPLFIDGVAELHADLFRRLDAAASVDAADATDAAATRAQIFRDYMTVHFRLEHLEDAGLSDGKRQRANANWMRVLRGWSFDADGREGAVLKGWIESRFGLLARFHGAPLRDFSAPAYGRYQEMRAAGLYGTNALEGQLDLLYAFGQYEFQRQSDATHLRLYRGINRLGDHEVLTHVGKSEVVLLNNLTSFSASRERAGEFGDFILEADVPVAKVFFHCALLPDLLKSEGEHLVIGGAYEVAIRTL